MWTTPITFLGWEISSNIITGDTLLSESDMVLNSLRDHGSPKGRSSWDPMLVLLACCNNEEKAGYSVVKGRASVDPLTGTNHFEIADDGRNCYVKKNMPDSFYKDIINRILEYKQM